MTDQPTPEQIKAYLDDLARLSVKHGVVIGATYDGPALQEPDEDFDGYSARVGELHEGHGLDLSNCRFDAPHMRDNYHNSVDITQLSAHERMKIMGGQG